ncbi:helix-turn-helix transcriptional regulator [Nocardioides sp. QY071]|uniref:helix-turn-helix domain-containing protein n=1 Tax=Nocardioides sp. QY071 TaxID=3044187 RepID=UPI00249B2D8A|nr:helix-turn-helix transcriptional regulator [Nocardioides sp. QY071]WGY04334.1 helix-turn-helix transcriptional regulator [Nocardioides sp. QY071]
MATPYYQIIRPAQAELRANIRQMAAARGWTLTDLARRADASYSKLTQGLGANRWFDDGEVDALADALEVSFDELMGTSVLKADARGSVYDKPHPRRVGQDVGAGNGRALCCECGTFRRFTVAEEVHDGRGVMDLDDGDVLGRRMVTTLPCRYCGRETLHAQLRTDTHRDISEEKQAGPTREQEALQRRDALIARLAGFNVDVHFRSRRKEKERADGYVSCYSFDESKDRWRIEIDPNTPARIQSVALLKAWTAISTDNHKVDWDPKKGVVFGPSDGTWEVAVEDLIQDIRRAMPSELQRLRLAIVDEITTGEAAQ